MMKIKQIIYFVIFIALVYMIFKPSGKENEQTSKSKSQELAKLNIISVAFSDTLYDGRSEGGKFFQICFDGPINKLKRTGAYVDLKFNTKDGQQLSLRIMLPTHVDEGKKSCTINNLFLSTYGQWSREERARRRDIVKKSIMEGNIKECNVQLFTDKGGKLISSISFYEF